MVFKQSRGSRRNSFVLGSLLVIGLTATATGCGAASGGGGSEGKTVGLSFGHLDQEFFVAVEDGLQKKADELGYTLDITDANYSSEEQVNQIETMITKGVDAIVYMPLDAAAANTAAQLANAADIPIIGIDSKPDEPDVELASYIATDSVASAEAGCTFLAEKMGGSGEMGWIRGILGSTPELERTEGCTNALQEYPDIEVVSDLSADFDQTKAFSAAQNMLSANPDMTAIFAESDAMAQGAAQAAEQAGREVFILGMDGFPSTYSFIKDGSITATQSQQPYQMGVVAGETLQQIFDGQTPEPVQYQEAFRVDQESVDQYQEELLYGPRFKDEYDG